MEEKSRRFDLEKVKRFRISETKKRIMLKWLFYFVILSVVYMQFHNFYLTSDYVSHVSNDYMVGIPDWRMGLSGGRWGYYFLQWAYFFLEKFHVSHWQNAFVIQILGNMLYAWAGGSLYVLFEKHFKTIWQKRFLDGFILLCFINPFMVETYVYGSFDWAVGILLAVLAAKWFAEGKYVKGVISALFAVSIYQTNILITLIIALAALFMEHYDQDWKKHIISYLKVAVLSVSIALFSILLQKVYVLMGNQGNPAKEAQIAASYVDLIRDVISSMISILTGMYAMYPRRFLPLFVMVVCLIGFAVAVRQKKLYQAILWVGMTGVLFLIPFSYAVATASAWFTQRTLLAVFFSLGMFMVMALFLVKDRQMATKVLMGLSAILFAVTIYYTETCILDCYMSQALDFQEVRCVQEEIQEYEAETGIEIRTVSVHNSATATYTNSLLHFNDGNNYAHRILYDAPTEVELLNYINQENYEREWMSEEDYQKYFDDKGWDVFNPSEQLYFEGDKLYWLIY